MKNPGWANNRGSPPYVSRNSSYQIPRSANAPAAMILKANTACGDEDGSFSILGLCSDFYASKRVPTITGTVTDATGAAVANARITVMNEATNVPLSTVSSGTGTYMLRDLPPGSYTVTAEVPGF